MSTLKKFPYFKICYFCFFEAMWNTERVSKMLEAVQFMFEFWDKQVLKVVYFQWGGGD